MTVHVAPLGTLYESPLVQQMWGLVETSRTVQDALHTVEAQQLKQAIGFLEQQLGRSGREIYTTLTAGGVDIAFGVEGRPWLLLIAHAEDEEIVAAVVQLAVDLAKADGADVPHAEYRGFTGYRIGKATIAAVGTRLLIGSRSRTVEGGRRPAPRQSADSGNDEAADSFHVSARLDLERLRAIPDMAQGLKLPADDGGMIALFGGWIDLLRREQRAEFNLRLADDGVDAVLSFSGADAASSPPLAGFWADAPDEQPAPLLMLPGTIFSTSWYRDYGALWQAREQLVTQDVIKKMEQADAEAAAQFEALGSAVSLSEVVQQFGPRFRVVVAEQPSPPYDVQVRNLLPAAAVVIELKDEQEFHTIADPLTRVLHLILSFEQKITSQPLEYAGATLHQLSQPHTPDEVRKRDLSAYNFRPTHTIARGHLIVGSTPEIVRQTIDALDAQRADPSLTLASGVTSQQVIHFRQFAAALDRIRESLVRQLVLQGGLDVETAEDELDVLLSFLQLFDTKAITSAFTDDGFELRSRIQP